MRALRVAGAALAALSLSACASVDPTKLAQAMNDLDPDCGKYTEINVTPLLVFGWPVPLITAKHIKSCNPDQLPAQPSLIRPGAVIGSSVP